ncbi:tryptophan-rich sensory protein [Calothrix rhizosoleniae]|uniref:tryptophan-rich sensory protein n=1 Tax=Calothrix rhizosoleniae TaxID=888997 RepID=UPI000B498D85|nr:tryptophan-rich sensory protein [Calothrix rhizosoleniae]
MEQSKSSNYRDLWRQIVTFVAIATAFIVNVISNIFPAGGINIGKISNTLFKNVLIIPANYAFAIWGLIYLGLFAFGIYQLLPSQRQDEDLRKVGYLLTIASLAQCIWVYLFLYRLFAVSVVAMLLILLPLIAIYLRLRVDKKTVSRGKKWCIHRPISIYLGWISVATIVNVACTLSFQGWNGWGISTEIWTIIMLSIATAIAGLIAIQNKDIVYPGVTVWALVAIALKHVNIPTLRITAILCILVLIGIILIQNLPFSRKNA